MMRNNRSTPEGTRDILFDDCLRRRTIQNTLSNLYKSWGYCEVKTPILEYYDIFAFGAGAYPQQQLYKLTGNKGHLLVMRPDTTTAVARLAATRLSGQMLPIRLFYNQSIFRSTRSFSGKQTECMQSGVELLGAGGFAADLEIVSMACCGMEACGVAEYRLEISHTGFIKSIFDKLQLPEDEKETIRLLIESKNFVSLAGRLAGLKDCMEVRALRLLPELFGSGEVLARVEAFFACEKGAGASADSILYLRRLYDALCNLGFADRVAVDLGLVHGHEYYTGVVFRGYAAGSGIIVVNGGRYDNLVAEFGKDMQAVGFAIEVDSLADVIPASASAHLCVPDALVFSAAGFEAAGICLMRALSAEGGSAEQYTGSGGLEEAKAYACSKGIKFLYHVAEKTERIDLNGEVPSV